MPTSQASSLALPSLALLFVQGCNPAVPDVDPCADSTVWYADADGDGYGDASMVVACTEPGATDEGGDCDDAVRAVNPSATEVCDEVDNDCDGTVDVGAVDAVTYYTDGDGDGYGRSDSPVESCSPDEGLATEDGDCDDGDNDFHPGASEADCTDPVDYNCDGSTGYADADADGWPACEDCDDTVATTNPLGIEVCDGTDNDCDGSIDEEGVSTWYTDADGDSYGDPATGVVACDAPFGTVADATDCDDTDARYHPGAGELCDDPADYNCDGSTGYADADGDGSPACEDCDDLAAAAHPGAVETCDGIDNDCDATADESDATDAGTWYADTDRDGSGEASTAVVSCVAPGGYVADPGDDCEPTDPTVYPGAPELCDVKQNDCDTTGWTSADEAGHVSTESATGAWGDVTDTFASGRYASPAAYTLPLDGTVWVCDGTWYVALVAPAGGSVTVEGRNGATTAVLDGASAGSVITAEASSSVFVTGVSLQNGAGTVPTDDDASFGGGVYAIGAAVTLTDTRLEGNSANYGGGIYVDGGTLTLDGVTVSSNTAGYGGGLDAINANVTASDTSFSSNTATNYGGGIYTNASGSQLILLTSGEMTDNYASYGGGMYTIASGYDGVTVDGTTIEGNLANYGAGIYMSGSSSATLTLVDATLANNVGMTYGAGVYASLSAVAELSIEGTTFDSNMALGNYGGGLYISASGVATVDVYGGSAFTGNSSTYYGGGVYYTSSSYGAFTMADTEVSGNETVYRGAGLYLSADYDVTLTDLSITSNTVTGTSSRYGAGLNLLLDGGAGTLTGCEVSDNAFGSTSTSSYGAGAYFSTSGSSTLTLDDSTFNGNTGATYGGGIYFTTSSYGAFTLEDLEISGNDALYRGGGLYVYSDYDTQLTQVSITANEVTGAGSSAQGAGAYLDILTLTLTDSDVSANVFGPSSTTGYGGGIYSTGGAITLAGTTFSSNTAYIGAGWYGTSSALALDEDSQMSGNSATYRGGGAYLANSDFLCNGSATTSGGFVGNTAPSGGAGVYIGDTSSTVTATVCDTGSGSDDNLAGAVPNDVSIASASYSYGNDETFTCTNRTCL